MQNANVVEQEQRAHHAEIRDGLKWSTPPKLNKSCFWMNKHDTWSWDHQPVWLCGLSHLKNGPLVTWCRPFKTPSLRSTCSVRASTWQPRSGWWELQAARRTTSLLFLKTSYPSTRKRSTGPGWGANFPACLNQEPRVDGFMREKPYLTVLWGNMPVQIPDDTDFASFKEQCETQDGWIARYNKGGVTVWCRDEETNTVQKLKASEWDSSRLASLHCRWYRVPSSAEGRGLMERLHCKFLHYINTRSCGGLRKVLRSDNSAALNVLLEQK